MPANAETHIPPRDGMRSPASLGLEDLLGRSTAELERALIDLGEKPYRGRQVASWIYARGVRDFRQMTDLPAELRDRLAARFRLGGLAESGRTETADHRTRKIAFRLPNGGVIESVYMATPKRITFCLSSQRGCGFGCRFCATGRMGRGRNLTAGEIVDQAIRLKRELPPATDEFNVVMMGMGEPLENYEAVVAALAILSDPDGLRVPAKRITISTVGLVPQILRLAESKTRYRLAISLHAASDDLRTKLMPINRTFPLEPLMRAARTFVERTGRRITFEYILIEQINDSRSDAAKLVRLVAQIPCKVNLIPYNPIGPGRFRRPSTERIEDFATYLRPRLAAVTVRYSQGVDIGAACGQLAGGHDPPRG